MRWYKAKNGNIRNLVVGGMGTEKKDLLCREFPNHKFIDEPVSDYQKMRASRPINIPDITTLGVETSRSRFGQISAHVHLMFDDPEHSLRERLGTIEYDEIPVPQHKDAGLLTGDSFFDLRETLYRLFDLTFRELTKCYGLKKSSDDEGLSYFVMVTKVRSHRDIPILELSYSNRSLPDQTMAGIDTNNPGFYPIHCSDDETQLMMELLSLNATEPSKWHKKKLSGRPEWHSAYLTPLFTTSQQCFLEMEQINTVPPKYLTSVKALKFDNISTIPSTPPLFVQGSHVIISGLQKRPDLNGKPAVVQGYLPKSDRFKIILIENGETFDVKEKNLCTNEEGGETLVAAARAQAESMPTNPLTIKPGCFFSYPTGTPTDEDLERAKHAMSRLSKVSTFRARCKVLSVDLEDDALVAAAERLEPRGLWDVLTGIFEEEALLFESGEFSGGSLSHHITNGVLRGDRERTDRRFRSADMARSAAIFMPEGSFQSFLRVTRGLCILSFEDSENTGRLSPLNHVARDLLRFVTMGLAYEVVGKAIFRGTPFATVAEATKSLLEVVSDNEWDENSAMEGMVNQMIAMLDAWSTKPGVLSSGPRSMVPMMAFDEMQQAMFKMMAVPIALETIKKGRALTNEDCEAAIENANLMSQFPQSAGAA